MQWEGKNILSDVDLTVNRGDFLAITGPNGGGKTTLLRIMLRLLRPSVGTVIYRNSAGGECNRLPIGYLPQKNMIDSRFPISVEEVISSGLMAIGRLEADERRTAVDEILRMVELSDHRRASIGNLSGGQRQAVTLLMATLKKPKLLLLDEHTAALDPKTAAKVLEISNKIVQENHLTTLMITHNMRDAIRYGNRLIMMNEGHVIYDVRGEEKTKLEVSDLLQRFEQAGGEANDRMILS